MAEPELKDIIENLEPNPVPTPNADPDPESSGGGGGNPDPVPAPDNKAFAKMRIDLKQSMDRVKELEAELAAAKKSTPTPTPNPEPETPKNENSQYEERIKVLEQEIQESKRAQVRANTEKGLRSLQTEFNLDTDGLYKFAEDARKMGYDLTKPDNYVGYYRAIHYQDLVNAEVERIKTQLSGGNPPTSGPKGNPQGGKRSVGDVLKAVDEATKKD